MAMGTAITGMGMGTDTGTDTGRTPTRIPPANLNRESQALQGWGAATGGKLGKIDSNPNRTRK